MCRMIHNLKPCFTLDLVNVTNLWHDSEKQTGRRIIHFREIYEFVKLQYIKYSVFITILELMFSNWSL